MLSIEDNELLTRVGPGTPMGELLRRYWHPIAASGELARRPTKEVTILGEELVLYKDRSGALGLIGRRCPHRRVSLVYGVPEDDGLRCQYHGWKFDQSGQCTEAPFEDTVNPEARFRDRIKLPGYPVQELGGLVFAYLGPQPAPLLPHWAPLTWDEAVHDIAITELPCNWLQCQENSLDPVHTEWLHGNYAQFVREQYGEPDGWMPRRSTLRHQKIGFKAWKYGISKHRLLEGFTEDSDIWKVGHPIIFPNILLVGSPFDAVLQFRVPIDDTHTYHVSHSTWRAAPGATAPEQPEVPYRYVRLRDEDGSFATQSFQFNQDFMAWITQGEIALRDQERLGESDKGVIMFRQMLKQQIELVRDGGEPMNVFREPGSEIVLDTPLEATRGGRQPGPRWPRYYPEENGYSAAADLINQVIDTYTAPKLVS
jgi:5,5'-dehydrodivanillate O-demethylase